MTFAIDDLPIAALLTPLRARLREAGNLLLKAPPGAGKTTCVPLALLDEPWLAGQRIIMLEPRRLAARNAAMHMAELLGEPIGERVGYRVRFEQRVGPTTRIEVVTEGILARRLQDDPALEGIGLVIFDEFHERHLDSDKTLALCLDAQAGLREDLRLLVMSATLDTPGLASLLDAPVLESEGRSFPVAIHHLAQLQELPLDEGVRRAVLQALDEVAEGDVLVFLPGVGEIRRVERRLAEGLDGSVRIATLYGDLPFNEQQRAILPAPKGMRKVVLTTAIAESSLTIQGVRVVIDGGFSRVPRFDARAAMTRLITQRVTRAAAQQRCGRAGRLGPGVCYKLWGEAVERGLVPYADAEIVDADLAPLVLDLALWGVSDANALRWLTPPPVGHFSQAVELLQGLQALDSRGRITTHGRALATLPLHPRLAHMLVRAKEQGECALAIRLAALVAERSPLRHRKSEVNDDLGPALSLVCRVSQDRHGADVDRHALKIIERSAGQFARLLGCSEQPIDSLDAAAGLLALAYPDRVAQLREPNGLGYRLANGRGVRLRDASLLRGSEWLVISELGGDAREASVYSALSITQAELEEHLGSQLGWQESLHWEAGRLVAEEQRRLGVLILARRTQKSPSSERLRMAVLQRIREQGLELLGWSKAASSLRERVKALHAWLPEQDWPDWSDAALLASLDHWLAPWLDGVDRIQQLARLDMLAVLEAELGWQRRQQVDEFAPSHLQVPSGSHIALEYRGAESPVLAVKLQELFGLERTPSVAQGRVAVTLHLLSPARRPIQVTQDLANFWANTYAEVRKELKGRYPKHPWPDDPRQAVATAKTKRALARG